MGLVLASSSPRRRELLEMLGLSFEVLPAAGEEAAEGELSPAELVVELALQKAREVAKKRPSSLVLGADTIVELEGEIFGKPRDEAHAAQMLRALSGRTHRVYTGVALVSGGHEDAAAELTEVSFRELTEAEIAAYIKTGEPMDKAGAYGAQGLAALFVSGIRGDFFNVMGLPLCLLGTMLDRAGLPVL